MFHGDALSRALIEKPTIAKIRDEYVIGILPGEGIGPEIIDVTLNILKRLDSCTPERFKIENGGEIGVPAKVKFGKALTNEVIDFCQSVFKRQGAILCGPGGERFVYTLRAQFDLFCKFTPIKALSALDNTGVIKPEIRHNANMVVIRENIGGLYFGEWGITVDGQKESAFHRFSYEREHVTRILNVAIKLASLRHNKLTVVLKPGGVPAISELWQTILTELTTDSEIKTQMLEVDNAMYQMIANPEQFDVVVAPNMFGDVLSDGAALLLGSRGLSFSGNFGNSGMAVFQTGHGAAHDLTGKDVANPIGQILSLAMLLRESFGLNHYAESIESAVEEVLIDGWRTTDIREPDCKLVGTKEMGALIGDRLENKMKQLAA
ncbi:MAG: 3-isopropylmalate dehydrogenase [Gammaproteobacteria bacterium]|nr:3-isopropylmalate dehydrogenase [Gammaproteobacteria bacterium]